MRTLLGWYRAGVDVEAQMPLLSTYLGHSGPENTFWYLSAVPELLFLASERLERRAGAVMSALAPTLEAYFTERLVQQRQASPNTIAAYRDAWRLLLVFVQQRIGTEPCQLDLADLDAPLVAAFLEHLETERHNSVRTRNARLAAIRSFFRFAALRHPEHAAVIARVLAIPTKRCERAIVSYLTEPEADALVASPHNDTWHGRRDHAILAVALQTGLRASELTGLRNQDVELRTGAHLRCWGKGRKATRDAPATPNRVGPTHLDEGVRRAPRRSAVPHPSGHPAQPRRPRSTRRQTHRRRSPARTIAGGQERHAPRAQPLLRDGPAPRWRRPLGARPLARPRAGRDHVDVPARRPLDQGTSPRPHQTTTRQAGPIPGSRPAPRLPQRALIMSTAIGRSDPIDSITAAPDHITHPTA